MGKRGQSPTGFLKLQCTFFNSPGKNQKSLAGTATVVQAQWVNREFKKTAKNKQNLLFFLFKSDYLSSKRLILQAQLNTSVQYMKRQAHRFN